MLEAELKLIQIEELEEEGLELTVLYYQQRSKYLRIYPFVLRNYSRRRFSESKDSTVFAQSHTYSHSPLLKLCTMGLVDRMGSHPGLAIYSCVIPLVRILHCEPMRFDKMRFSRAVSDISPSSSSYLDNKL